MKMGSLLSIVLCGALLAITATPAGLPAAYAQGDCGDAPTPRLTIGGNATVLFTDGEPLNVRDAASLSGNPITQIPEGADFQVADGPVCADAIYWWSITAESVSGWIAEGAEGQYVVV